MLLTAFDVITGVSASRRTVYITSPEGIGALDRDFGRWLPPVTAAQGYPGGMVTAIAADPVEDAAWVGLPGMLVYYRPLLDDLTTAIVPGVIDDIVFDARDPGAGAFVRSAGGWSLASRTGFVMPVDASRVPPAGARERPWTLREVYQKYPSLQSLSGLLTRDEQLLTWPVISGSKTPDQSEVWLGTRGGGLYRVDPVFVRSEHRPYGLLESGTGALASAADGVWMAGLGRSPIGRGGLTFASTDLQQWRWLEGPLTHPLASARAHRLAVRGSVAWVATDRGIARLDTRDPSSFRAWTSASGLPADEALSVAPGADGVWVGTTRGLVFITESANARMARRADVSEPIAAGTAVGALLLASDTLWIGSDAGLLLLRASSPDSAPRRAAAARLDARFSRPIRALARNDSLAAVATAGDLLTIDLHTGRPTHSFDAVDAGVVRGVNAMAMDERTIWLAGSAGVLIVTRANGVSRFLPVPTAIPAEAYDVLLDPDYAWIATRSGVLRLRRLTDGGVR